MPYPRKAFGILLNNAGHDELWLLWLPCFTKDFSIIITIRQKKLLLPKYEQDD